MKLTAAGLKAIIGEEARRVKMSRGGKKRLKEATRDPHNLESDLLELQMGETLELETFGGGDFEPGRLIITRVEDDDGYDDEGPLPQFTITSFERGAGADLGALERELKRCGVSSRDVRDLVGAIDTMMG